MTRRIALLLALIAWSSVASLAQKAENENKTPTAAELQAITARGKTLYEYDVASWHATDVVQDLKPEKGSTRYYIAKKGERGWVVAFGRLSEAQDKFLIVYEATQGTKPEFFTAKRYEPPLEDTNFYFYAARAFEAALKDLGPVNRPYNDYAIPSETGQLYVYLLPASTKDGIYPLGGDVRYTFSADGGTTLDKRQMHKTILEVENPPQPGQSLAAGTHSHVLSNQPEDSDVFHVLTRRPLVPEYVGMPDGISTKLQRTERSGV